MPVAMASGLTEIAWPNDIEATVLGDQHFAVRSGWADSASSLGRGAEQAEARGSSGS